MTIDIDKAFHVIRDGRVKATIWHEVRDGVRRFHVAFTKLVTDDNRWWDSGCFQRDDMPSLSRLADDVHLWISQQAKRLAPADGESHH
jgi:hypothetical protein